MRAPLVLALSVAGIVVGGAVAQAADLPHRLALRSGAIAARVAPLVIYQYEPGIAVRAYWLPPWRHRHYFPHGIKSPRFDDDAEVNAPSQPAEAYQRSWSNASAFPCDCTPPGLRDESPLPPPPEHDSKFPPPPEPPNS